MDVIYDTANEDETHIFLHVFSLSMQNRLKSKSVSVEWYGTLRESRLTLVIYSGRTIEVYCSNGHRSGEMAFRFYQRRLYSAL